MPFEVAIVSRDPAVRMAAARAFDAAPAGWSVTLVEEAPADVDAVVHGCDVAAGVGEIVFHPERPGEALRAVAAMVPPGAPNRVVTVVGAAGGVGATSLALHLAAEWGPRACCAELRGPGLAARLGLPPDARTWSPHADDLASSALPVSGAFRVLLAPASPPGAAAFPLETVRGAFERVVVDAGSERDLEPLLGDVSVLVTSPTRPGAVAARGVLEAFPDARWAVVVNRAGPGGQIMGAGLEELIGRRLALELPCAPALRDAEDEARLLSGRWHRWRRAVARLARAVDEC